MSKLLNKFNKAMQKGHTFLVLIIVLIAVAVGGIFYIGIVTDVTLGTGQAATDIKEVDDNKLVIEDIYEGERSIPKFKYPANTYDPDKFTDNNGMISYPDGQVGIDVSEHQGKIDWKKVKESGVDFAIVRAGYRGYTRGRIYEDQQFKANLEGAADAGIKVGVYFFSQAVSVAEAEEEAGYILSAIGDAKVEYPIVFDWEQISVDPSESAPRTEKITGDQVSEFAAAFCNKIDKAGYNTAVYMNKSFAYDFLNLNTISDYDIWYAEYQPKPSMYYDFKIWQYSDSANIDGIEGTCDINISFKNYSK